jgi:hypothetical protein
MLMNRPPFQPGPRTALALAVAATVVVGAVAFAPAIGAHLRTPSGSNTVSPLTGPAITVTAEGTQTTITTTVRQVWQQTCQEQWQRIAAVAGATQTRLEDSCSEAPIGTDASTATTTVPLDAHDFDVQVTGAGGVDVTDSLGQLPSGSYTVTISRAGTVYGSTDVEVTVGRTATAAFGHDADVEHTEDVIGPRVWAPVKHLAEVAYLDDHLATTGTGALG